jgi:hypothetical protein
MVCNSGSMKAVLAPYPMAGQCVVCDQRGANRLTPMPRFGEYFIDAGFTLGGRDLRLRSAFVVQGSLINAVLDQRWINEWLPGVLFGP